MLLIRREMSCEREGRKLGIFHIRLPHKWGSWYTPLYKNTLDIPQICDQSIDYAETEGERVKRYQKFYRCHILMVLKEARGLPKWLHNLERRASRKIRLEFMEWPFRLWLSLFISESRNKLFNSTLSGLFFVYPGFIFCVPRASISPGEKTSH